MTEPTGPAVPLGAPAAPLLARRVFADRLDLAARYVALLAGEGVLRGLIGPRETPRLWERHLLNCALLADAFAADTDVCDLGAGAGLPGIVLAIRRPDLRMTLVEPSLRRTTFLCEVVEDLGLDRVEVVRARAEELHGAADFSAVTSRAVAPLSRLLDLSMPVVRKGGALVAMKGASVWDEVRSAQPDLLRHGAGAVEVQTYGDGQIDPPTTVVRVEATLPSRLGWQSLDPERPAGRSKRCSRERKGGRT